MGPGCVWCGEERCAADRAEIRELGDRGEWEAAREAIRAYEERHRPVSGWVDVSGAVLLVLLGAPIALAILGGFFFGGMANLTVLSWRSRGR